MKKCSAGMLVLLLFWSMPLINFAQTGDKKLSLVLEPGQSSFSPSILMDYMESIELRLHYFGFDPVQVKVYDRKDKIYVEVMEVTDPKMTTDLITGTGDFKILPIHKFDDQATMTSLFTKFENISATVNGKSCKLTDVFKLNTTTMPGYPFRRYPPAVIGMANGKDIQIVDQLIASPEVLKLLPANASFIWAQKASKLHDGQYDLYLADMTPYNGLDGDHVSRTKVYQEANRFSRVRDIIDIWLDEEGTAKFDTISKANTGRELIIVLNNAVISAPIVEGPIETGNLQIEGPFNGIETTALSRILRIKSLPGSPKVVSSSLAEH